MRRLSKRVLNSKTAINRDYHDHCTFFRTNMLFVVIWLLIASLAFILTWMFRRYALARSLMDIPNARSSHTTPTPRGGGVAIVATFMLALGIQTLYGQLSWQTTAAFGGAGGTVAILGFFDDRGHIAAQWRLIAHFSAAAWALFWIRGMPPIDWFGTDLSFGWLGQCIGAIYLVWMLNLYNFMDGIDGIAGVEAISVCIGGALLYALSGDTQSGFAPLLLAASVLGFLCWNFPPAKIFMGDAGSGFLGMILGLFTLHAAWSNPSLFWSWLILLGVFIVDATFTLIRRLLRREKVYEAHRSHAYQYASRLHGSHRKVTLGVLAINIAWLFPLATAVSIHILSGVTALLMAYIPIFILAIKYKAGVSDLIENVRQHRKNSLHQ